MAPTIPKKIGKYDVVDVIGKGGMGIVYRAKDPFLDRMVAIKIMTISYADYPDLLQRFYREAKATANLQHPNIVTVYELGEHEGSPYLAMQYLEGASLETILRSGQQLTLLQKIDIIVQACHGLSYAHQKGIIHRDIKPGNIMVLKDSSVKIVDFGIARIGDTNFTRTGQFMGSLNYMSLEQLNDKLQVDQRTDVYSTGVVLYQILTGALPFEADSTGATLMKILNEAPPPFAKYISGFPPELETITIRALAKDRDHRYGSADELALDLTQLLDRLKHELISVHMERAELQMQQNNLFQANDELMEVLKLDRQHTRASSMLRTLRKQIEKEQSAERARQLREQAEEAISREDFDPALGFLEQAIHIDTTNVDLQQLRSKVQAAKAEIEHLRQVMQRAENAHRAGNLDTAKQAIEEVLARRPNDTRVKSLYRMIEKELEDRLRQKRLENLLEAARKEMANRRYTAAFDILKEAEKVDPDALAVRSLLETLTTARDQEKRRTALEQVTRQVEQAINTDDHQSALSLLAEGLKRFPGEPALLKLRDLAENQKQTAQAKSLVRERISAAREILNAGNSTGARRVLEDALKKAPGNAQLESMLSMVDEQIAREHDEQAKARCIQQANEALDRHAYDEAIRLLEAGQVRFTTSPEIDSRLRFAREQQAKQAKQQDVESSVRRAQEFLRAQEYDRAIALLEAIVSRAPDEELGIVLEEARRRRDDLNRQIAASIAKGQQFLQEGSPGKAVEFLQAQPTAFRRSDQFRDLLLAAAQQNRPPEPEPAIVPATEYDAPEPAKTMMWESVAPPEPEVEEQPAPRVPTGRVVKPAPPPPEPVVAAPGLLQRLTKQQKILAAAALGVVLFVVLAIVLWPSSKPTPPTAATTAAVPTNQPPPPTPPVVETGTLFVQTNEDGADIFVDDALKGSTTQRKLSLTIPTGPHKVRVEKSGFDASAPQTVDLATGSEKRLKFTLTASKTPGQPVAKDSYLMITGTQGAEVKVDGTSFGALSTTAVYAKVNPDSPHHIEATLNGYKPFSLDKVRVKPGDRKSVTAELEALPQPKPLPTIAFFKGPADPVPPGKARLSWSTKDASSAEIDGGVGNVNTSGEVDVTVTQNTTFKLTAKGADGRTTEDSFTVRVAQPPKAPAIVSFTPSATKIKPGDSVTLNWTTADASSTTINGNPVNPPSSGSLPVSPTETTTYTLVANGSGNVTPARQLVTVTVEKGSTPPPQPPQPPTDPTKAAAPLVQDALDRLTKSYQNQIVDDVKKEWTGMTKQQEDNLKKIFNSPGWKSVAVEYTACSNLSVTTNTATINCTGTTLFTKDGKRQSAGTVPFAISLKKAGDAWRVDAVVYVGKK